MNTRATADTTGLADKQMIMGSPLGGELTEAQAEALAERISVFCLQDGNDLLEEGHADTALYVIVNGKLEVTKNAGGGEPVTLHLLHAGDMAGELGFLDGLPHSAGLRAIGNCTVFALKRDDLEYFLEKDPKLVYEVMRAITRTVHTILRKMNIQHVEMQNYISHQHGRY